MNQKQQRLIKDVRSQLQAIHKIADEKMNGEVFSDGKIDADEVYLRSLIALSALLSFHEEQSIDDYEAVNKANNIDIAEAMAQ